MPVPKSQKPTQGWRTLSGTVAEELRHDILTGKLRPGQRLRQNQLAERFSISSTPIREALSILSAQGLVRIDDRRGASVFKPTLKELTENHMIREVLEALAIEIAIPNLTTNECSKLQDICEEMCQTTDAEQWLQLNSEFHMTMYRAADSPMLIDLIVRMRDIALPYLSLLVRSDHLANRGDDEHVLILKSVLDGDMEQARAHTRSHIRSTVAELAKVLDPSRSESANNQGVVHDR